MKKAEPIDRKVVVALLMRKPFGGRHSVERLFRTLAAVMPSDIIAKERVSRFTSQGFLRRVYITIEAAFRQEEVTHVTGDTYFLTALLRRRRTVLTILDGLSISRLSGVRGWVFRLLWYRLPMSKARVITVISDATKERLISVGLGRNRDIRVVHCCLMPGHVPFARSFDRNRPVLLLVGTNWNKNLVRVAQAVRGLQCHLRIVGMLTFEQRAELRRLGTDYSNVESVSDSEMIDEYRRCDMLVFASLEEGFGLPIIEAQAIGRPVVTSNRSSMPEVAGEAAELVDPTCVDSIRRGIDRIVLDADRRESLVRLGFENVKRFEPAVIAARYASIYREIAGSD
jgi:glycosyltransferase involved in cell wall biosynthesis